MFLEKFPGKNLLGNTWVSLNYFEMLAKAHGSVRDAKNFSFLCSHRRLDYESELAVEALSKLILVLNLIQLVSQFLQTSLSNEWYMVTAIIQEPVIWSLVCKAFLFSNWISFIVTYGCEQKAVWLTWIITGLCLKHYSSHGSFNIVVCSNHSRSKITWVKHNLTAYYIEVQTDRFWPKLQNFTVMGIFVDRSYGKNFCKWIR